MKKLLLPLLMSSLVFFSNCSYHRAEDISPKTGCDTVNVTYAKTVKPILENNCYSCHASGIANGNVVLDNYNDVKANADNGNIMAAITHAPGYVPMPYNLPKLDDCTIGKIRAWISQGAQNN